MWSSDFISCCRVAWSPRKRNKFIKSPVRRWLDLMRFGEVLTANARGRHIIISYTYIIILNTWLNISVYYRGMRIKMKNERDNNVRHAQSIKRWAGDRLWYRNSSIARFSIMSLQLSIPVTSTSVRSTSATDRICFQVASRLKCFKKVYTII